MNTPLLLSWALRYIKLGFAVIPLRGKIPLTEHGSKDASLDEAQVSAWWAASPDANIGIATGHRFFVMDVDVKGGGEDSFDFLRHQHGPFPETIEQVTGTGGKHLLFQLPDFPVRNSASLIAPGIDIRGVGGYIVVAPSIHPDTKREYVWDGIKEIEQQAIAPAPGWLLDRLRVGGAAGASQLPAAKPVAPTISEGNRNAQMFKLASSLRSKGLSEPEILATLKASNQIRCAPPLPDEELTTIAKSSARYTPDARGNLFRRGRPAKGDASDAEAPVTLVDVEAAVDDAIKRDDLIGAVRLAPEVAKIRSMFQVIILAKFRKHFGREWPAAAFTSAMKDAAAGGDGSSPPPASPPPDQTDEPPGGPDLRGYPHTDAGNGERIVALWGRDVRYCVEMSQWLVWDGKRWAVDATKAMRQRHKQMARLLYAQAVDSPNLEKHARASESLAACTNALGYAATEKGIPILAAELDQQPYLLCCPNGVVDLRTGTLLPHQREFMITKMCPVEYDPTAQCRHFLDFLHWAMGASMDRELTEHTVRLVGFLQRAFGYALTSDVTEKAVFILHGKDGNNGKTTLVTLFRDLLGKDYSGQIAIESVMSAKAQDATMRADLADLRGVRLVITSEVEKEHKLNEGKIKYITAGTAPIKSCRKYENPIEFPATHKLFMDCNHLPIIRGVDEAIWKRLKLIPFEVTISEEEKDLHLPDKLREELPGVLAWAVRGAMAWLADGLGDPPEVSSAGIVWREHDDPLKEFLEDCCEIGDDLFVRASDLAAGYEWWAKQNRERYPLGREGFNERIQSKGFTQSRSRRIDGRQARTWEGIELKPDVEAVVKQRGGPSAKWFSDE